MKEAEICYSKQSIDYTGRKGKTKNNYSNSNVGQKERSKMIPQVQEDKK